MNRFINCPLTLLLFIPVLAFAASGVSSPIPALYANALRIDFASTACGADFESSASRGVSSVQVRHAEFHSVKEWGAVGDGITVDTTKIQNAVNSLNSVYLATGQHQTLDLSNGVFLVDAVSYIKDDGVTIYGATSVKLLDGVDIVGNGTIKVKNSAYGLGTFYRVISSRDTVRLSDVSIRGITIDGNSANQVACTQCGNILLEGLQNIVVDGVHSLNANGVSIMLRGTVNSFMQGIAVKNNYVSAASNIGIQISQFSGLSVTENFITGASDNCIDLYGENGTTTAHAKDFVVSGNTCSGGNVGVFIETSRDGVVSGNTVNNCAIGYTVNRINGQPHNITITGNNAYSCLYGARVTGDTGGVSIRANAFYGYSVAGVALGGGNVGRVSKVDVSENFFTPASAVVPTVLLAGEQAAFLSGKSNVVNSNGIEITDLLKNRAINTIAVAIDNFRVLPYQECHIKKKKKGSDPEVSPRIYPPSSESK